MAEDRDSVESALAVYVHWPFCLAKCPYCDFNSHVATDISHAQWRQALIAELNHFANETNSRTVGTVFFGGGTPSLMEPETVAGIIACIGTLWRLSDDAEITLEANPTSVELARFGAFRDAGINRVSLGVQSLEDSALAFLGRGHSAAEAIDAVKLAARLFPRFSFDLIYARPGQSVAEWRAELGRALEFVGDHLSLYQLTIEVGTPFDTLRRRGVLTSPDPDHGAALYEITQRITEDAGLPGYEISNHARAGAESRHNLAYWRSGEYVGVGPGAHGRLIQGGRTIATCQRRQPQPWLRAVEENGHGTEERAIISDPDRINEILMMGLRLKEGVARGRFRSQTGVDIVEALDHTRMEALIEGGFLVLDPDRLWATPEGCQRLNAVLATLLAHD